MLGMPSKPCSSGCTCGRHKPKTEKHLTFACGDRNKEHLRQLASQGVGGQNRSEDWRRKVSETLTGRPLSEEHRRKMAAINSDPARIKQRSEARKARRKPAENHQQMHKRLVRDRGPAKSHPCVDCGGPAKDWSHDCLTWENTTQEIRNRHGKRLVFSTDPAAYHARCQPCHSHLDAKPPPWDLHRPST
jgi:hypothetical protein